MLNGGPFGPPFCVSVLAVTYGTSSARDRTRGFDMPKTIHAFYSAHSAFAYIGARELQRIANAADAQIVHRPFDLRTLMEEIGGAVGNQSAAKRSYYFGRQIERWAEYHGVPILDHVPETHHLSYDLANRLIIAASQTLEPDLTDALAHAIMEAHWRDGADLSNSENLVAISKAANCDGAALLAEAETAPVIAAHTANTAEALSRPMLGSPTYVVDGDMFYGQDTLPLVKRALAKPFADTWDS